MVDAGNPSDPRTDAELIAAAQRGDGSAFEVLYLRHRDFVVRIAQRICGDGNDALDVLQETFLYVLRKAKALELRARFTTFLYPVVRNLALQRRRARASGTSLEAEPLAGASPTWREDLVAALSGLPAEQRETLLLRVVDGMSLLEVAEALAIPVGTVKSRLHQALAALRNDPRARHYFLP